MSTTRGDDASIYAESFSGRAPPVQRGPITWLKRKVKRKDEQLDQTGSTDAPVSDRFRGEHLPENGGWTVASLRLPDTANANRAARAHVILHAALLLVGEVSPLFLSMPQAFVSMQTAPINDNDIAGSNTTTDVDGSGSYAWKISYDEATVPAVVANDSGSAIGLGIDVRSIAIVGVLMSLCAVALRRSISQKVEVSSPWAALKFAGCAVVAAALISPPLIRLGTNRTAIWLGITWVTSLLAKQIRN